MERYKLWIACGWLDHGVVADYGVATDFCPRIGVDAHWRSVILSNKVSQIHSVVSSAARCATYSQIDSTPFGAERRRLEMRRRNSSEQLAEFIIT